LTYIKHNLLLEFGDMFKTQVAKEAESEIEPCEEEIHSSEEEIQLSEEDIQLSEEEIDTSD
jgi:hypothetical protein